jgi:hypothetical protein
MLHGPFVRLAPGYGACHAGGVSGYYNTLLVVYVSVGVG